MSWAKENLTSFTEWQNLDGSDLRIQNDELFSDMRAGFFLLRVSEVEGLRMKDARLTHEDGGKLSNHFHRMRG